MSVGKHSLGTRRICGCISWYNRIVLFDLLRPFEARPPYKSDFMRDASLHFFTYHTSLRIRSSVSRPEVSRESAMTRH